MFSKAKIAVGVLALAGTMAACTAEFPDDDVAGAPRQAEAVRHDDEVQRSLDALVDDDGYVGVLAAVRDVDGRTRDYTAGVGELASGEPVPVNGQVRIASNTKMFTATVVLQLVGEDRIGLDEPVETYLPNVVRGEGIDGRDITVRQLLQHTSGIADYDDVLITDYFAVQHKYFEPRQLVDAALTKPALFAPGQGWSYSNANYVLAGLVVQKVTGRPIGEEITNRVIDRLELEHTYWPAYDDQTIRERHPHGYWPGADGKPVDVTEQDMSMAWSAGQVISTPHELNTFMTELLDGDLMEPEQLEEMRTLVDAPDFDLSGGARVGLGIATTPLSCGGVAWTHGGNAPGFVTRNGITEDGRAATIVTTSVATTEPAAKHLEEALNTALCT